MGSLKLEIKILKCLRMHLLQKIMSKEKFKKSESDLSLHLGLCLWYRVCCLKLKFAMMKPETEDYRDLGLAYSVVLVLD